MTTAQYINRMSWVLTTGLINALWQSVLAIGNPCVLGVILAGLAWIIFGWVVATMLKAICRPPEITITVTHAAEPCDDFVTS